MGFMGRHTTNRVLETSVIVVGYAMSRLDRQYLRAFGHRSWKAAFADAGAGLAVAPSSLKNLRDEFDPVHGNSRRGWHARPLRKSRQRVLAELCEGHLYESAPVTYFSSRGVERTRFGTSGSFCRVM